MASDLTVGDSDIPTLDVAPADGTTAATLVLRKPDGSSTPVTVTADVLVPIPGTSPTQYSQRWTATAPVVYDQPKKSVLHWEVTGTGQGVEDIEVWVATAPTAGGVTWAPSLAQVAAHVPWLTISLSEPGSQTYETTFTGDTSPDPTVAGRHISDAVNLVTPLVTVMPDLLDDLAGTVAALYAAASLAAAYARTADDAARAATLLARATTAFKQLEEAAEQAGVAVEDDEPILIAPYPTGCGHPYLFL